mmetsp:Transcript_10408/g.31353  ORF Transcript_10408/g.31353 Transcript_10408/m.31353 type:complete len:290 (-) Transcript_10408:301-1170(-)
MQSTANGAPTDAVAASPNSQTLSPSFETPTTKPSVVHTVAGESHGAACMLLTARLACEAMTFATIRMLVSTVLRDSRTSTPPSTCEEPESHAGSRCDRAAGRMLSWSSLHRLSPSPSTSTAGTLRAHNPRAAGARPMTMKTAAAVKHATLPCAGDFASSTRPASSSVKRLPNMPTKSMFKEDGVGNTAAAWCTSAVAIPGGSLLSATYATARTIGATTRRDRESNHTSATTPPASVQETRPRITAGSTTAAGRMPTPLTSSRTALYCAAAHSKEPAKHKHDASPPAAIP